MATTRGWALRGDVKDAIDYILDLKHNQEKTNEGVLVDWSGHNTFSPYSAGYSWKLQKLSAKCHSDIVGYHFQQSFPEGTVSPEEALELSRLWIEEITGGNCEFVLAVHTNTRNIHTHIIVNPVQTDGTIWQVFWKKDKIRFREASDRILKSHGHTILEKTAVGSRSYFEWMADRTTNETDQIRAIIEYLCPKVENYQELKDVLNKMGFKTKDAAFDEEELSNQSLFCFTVNKVLLDQIDSETSDPNRIKIRLPKTKSYLDLPADCFDWIKKDVNARVTIPKGIDLFVDGKPASIEDIRPYFGDRTKRETAGLRIMVPGGKRYVKTKYIDSRDGKLTADHIQNLITGEGTDPLVRSFLAAKTYTDINELRREMFSQAGIVMSSKSCTSYLSQRQENYYKQLAEKCEKRRNQLSYHRLMMSDRKNLPVLEYRRTELIAEIDEVTAALKEAESIVIEMEKEILEETSDISQEKIEDTELYVPKTVSTIAGEYHTEETAR